MTDYFGNLYTHLFTPANINNYFSNFLKTSLYYYLGTDLISIKPLLTGFKIFNYNGTLEDAYTGVLAFSFYHSFEVIISFNP